MWPTASRCFLKGLCGQAPHTLPHPFSVLHPCTFLARNLGSGSHHIMSRHVMASIGHHCPSTPFLCLLGLASSGLLQLLLTLQNSMWASFPGIFPETCADVAPRHAPTAPRHTAVVTCDICFHVLWLLYNKLLYLISFLFCSFWSQKSPGGKTKVSTGLPSFLEVLGENTHSCLSSFYKQPGSLDSCAFSPPAKPAWQTESFSNPVTRTSAFSDSDPPSSLSVGLLGAHWLQLYHQGNLLNWRSLTFLPPCEVTLPQVGGLRRGHLREEDIYILSYMGLDLPVLCVALTRM